MNLGKLKNYLNVFSLQQAAISIRDRFFAPEHEEVPYERWLEHTRISSRGYAKVSKEVFHFQPKIGVYAHAVGETGQPLFSHCRCRPIGMSGR